jgi:hypothetical protein
MQSQTALKVAIGLGVVSVTGSAFALWNGVSAVGIAIILAAFWAAPAILLLHPIARLFPSRAQEIAVGVALVSAGVGALSICRYSTAHVALSLGMMGCFWRLAADLLSGRGNLIHRSVGGIYEEFRTRGVKPLSPLAKTLDRGSIALFGASIVCLFTITTW